MSVLNLNLKPKKIRFRSRHHYDQGRININVQSIPEEIKKSKQPNAKDLVVQFIFIPDNQCFLILFRAKLLNIHVLFVLILK